MVPGSAWHRTCWGEGGTEGHERGMWNGRRKGDYAAMMTGIVTRKERRWMADRLGRKLVYFATWVWIRYPLQHPQLLSIGQYQWTLEWIPYATQRTPMAGELVLVRPGQLRMHQILRRTSWEARDVPSGHYTATEDKSDVLSSAYHRGHRLPDSMMWPLQMRSRGGT